MRERALVIGDEPSLVGILTEPAAADARDGSPAFVILNAGLLHRVGPNRINVQIARGLAEEGFPALRVDLSGLGDSDARKDDLSFQEAHIADTRAVMDHLERRHGIDSFVLTGLCSGADTSLRTAAEDARVVGVAPIDGYAYRTPGYYLRHYGSRVLKAEPWLNFLERNVVDRLVGGDGSDAAENGGGPPVDPYERDFPPREEACDLLQRLADRRVQGLYLYTAGQDKYLNGGSQFWEMFGSVEFRDTARVEYFESSDHTFTLLRNQIRLERTIRKWARSVDWAEAGRSDGRLGPEDGGRGGGGDAAGASSPERRAGVTGGAG